MSTIQLSWQFEKCNKDEDQKNFARKDFGIFEFAKQKFQDILQYNMSLLYMPTATLIFSNNGSSCEKTLNNKNKEQFRTIIGFLDNT